MKMLARESLPMEWKEDDVLVTRLLLLRAWGAEDEERDVVEYDEDEVNMIDGSGDGGMIGR